MPGLPAVPLLPTEPLLLAVPLLPTERLLLAVPLLPTEPLPPTVPSGRVGWPRAPVTALVMNHEGGRRVCWGDEEP